MTILKEVRERPCGYPREGCSGQKEQMCKAPKAGTRLDHSRTSIRDPMTGDELAKDRALEGEARQVMEQERAWQGHWLYSKRGGNHGFEQRKGTICFV